MFRVCGGVIHAGKEADISELSLRAASLRAVPLLELACMEATHLTSMACKVSATECFLVVSSYFWARELFITHTCNRKIATVQWDTICSRSCKLPSELRKRQTLKFTESQHVKQKKPGTCQLFTNSKHSLSFFAEQRSTLFRFTQQMHDKFRVLRPEVRSGCKTQNRHARHNDKT